MRGQAPQQTHPNISNGDSIAPHLNSVSTLQRGHQKGPRGYTFQFTGPQFV